MFPEIRNPVDLAKRLGLVSLQEQACVPGGRKPPPTPIERKVLQRNKRFADFSVIEGFFLGQPMQLAVARGMRRLVARVKY